MPLRRDPGGNMNVKTRLLTITAGIVASSSCIRPPPGSPHATSRRQSACPEPETRAQGPVKQRWIPGPITSFGIFHFDGFDEFERKLQTARTDVLTLELDQIERAGGRRITDRAHAQGTNVICYVSAAYEDWRCDAGQYPQDGRGAPICSSSDCSSTYPGERWGDLRNPRVRELLARRAERAASVGCDGIEFDNIDVAFNDTGWSITPAENVAAAAELAAIGHARGLAVLAKNSAEIARELALHFDGVFVESCHSYQECASYRPYAGKLVAMVEYEVDCSPLAWAACQRKESYFAHPADE